MRLSALSSLLSGFARWNWGLQPGRLSQVKRSVITAVEFMVTLVIIVSHHYHP